MAITSTAITGGTIGIANTNGVITANTTAMNPYYNGYDVNRDTIYGIPSHDWHRMPQSEQRYYAERYGEREFREREYRYRREMDRMYDVMAEQKQVLVKKAPTSDYMNNTLLLLEN